MTDSNIIPFRACEAFPSLDPPHCQFTTADISRMNLLRGFARESLLTSRADLELACRLIAVDRQKSLRQFALALFGTLSEYAYRRMYFYRVGTPDLSESEIWLGRVLDAFRDHDTPEGRALIAWRVRPLGHRRVRFLVGGLADAVLEHQRKVA